MKVFQSLTLQFETVEDRACFLAKYEGSGSWVRKGDYYVNDSEGVILGFMNFLSDSTTLEVGNIIPQMGGFKTLPRVGLKRGEYNALLSSFSKDLEGVSDEFGFQMVLTPGEVILSDKTEYWFKALVTSLKTGGEDWRLLFEFCMSAWLYDEFSVEDLEAGLVAEGVPDHVVDLAMQKYETCRGFMDWSMGQCLLPESV